MYIYIYMYIYLNICIYCIMSYMYVQSKQRMHLAKTRLESHRETARNNKEKEREAGEALRGKAQAEKLSQKLECQYEAQVVSCAVTSDQ